MKTNELILNSVKGEYKREIGRYWATDIYKIIKGYLTPDNFFTEPVIELEGARNILSGEAYEEKWKKILEENGIKFKYGDEIKKELIIENFILVVKPDFEFKDWVLETKYPVKPLTEIPERYKYQLECEYRATEKQVYLGVFSYPFNLTYFKYSPNEERWKKIKTALINFDKALRLKYKDQIKD